MLNDIKTVGWKTAFESLIKYNKPYLFLKKIFVCSWKGHDEDQWAECWRCFKESKSNA